MSRSGFFYPNPDLSLSMFSTCRYWVPVRYLTLTNIFTWIIQLHLETKYPYLSCSLVGFLFILLKQSIYFHKALPYSAYAITTLASTFLVLAGECVTLHCDSRPSCAASWSVCETQPTLGTSISSTAFYKFLRLTRKKTWTRCSSISHTFSISSIARFICSAVWDPRN